MPTRTAPNRTLLTLPEVARRLECSTTTVRRMIDAGALRPIRFSARSHMRFRVSDVERLLAPGAAAPAQQAVEVAGVAADSSAGGSPGAAV